MFPHYSRPCSGQQSNYFLSLSVSFSHCPSLFTSLLLSVIKSQIRWANVQTHWGVPAAVVMVMCAFSRQTPWLPGVLIMAHYVICADIVFNRPAHVAMATWMGQWFWGAGVLQLAAVLYAVCLLVTYFDVVVRGVTWGVSGLHPEMVCVWFYVYLPAVALSAKVPINIKARVSQMYYILLMFKHSDLNQPQNFSSLRFKSDFSLDIP